MSGEFRLIDRIAALTAPQRVDVRAGIGDDAAILVPPPGQELVCAMDTLIDGVHFPTRTDPGDIGYKALAVNLSDLAAMGAEPAWAMLSLTLPSADMTWVETFIGGFTELAQLHDIALIGGDTVAGPLSVTVQLTGFVEKDKALRRRGGEPGDSVFVTGTLGDAATGLDVIKQTLDAGEHAHFLTTRLNRPSPRIDAGIALRGLASAAIDISDGLGDDLKHLLAFDQLGAEIELESLPASAALQALFPGESRWAYQFAGDDYELCFTASARNEAAIRQALEAVSCPVTRIGQLLSSPGLRCFSGGAEINVPDGWRHFHG